MELAKKVLQSQQSQKINREKPRYTLGYVVLFKAPRDNAMTRDSFVNIMVSSEIGNSHVNIGVPLYLCICRGSIGQCVARLDKWGGGGGEIFIYSRSQTVKIDFKSD